jgi:hypothetical protein
MTTPAGKRSWLFLALSTGGLSFALFVKPGPAYALDTCLDSPGNACCFDCSSGAQVMCGEGVCLFPNHRWPDS